jgi:hypothetical protein
MSFTFQKNRIALAIAAAAGSTAALIAPAHAAKNAPTATYVAGDFHNHTTCSDGSISMQKLVKKSTDTTDTPWGLDWFVQAGHGGNGNRNCTLAEDASLATPAYPLVYAADGVTVLGPTTTWQNSNPAIQPKGDVSGSAPNQNMWRWQSLQEFQYPLQEYLSAYLNKPLFVGMESVVAGHEHTSMSIITGQMPASIFTTPLPTSAGYTAQGNDNALSQWTYCFDRATSDTSRGDTANGSGIGIGNNWDCSIPDSPNSTDPTIGWNDAAKKLIPPSGSSNGTYGHLKTVEAVKWMNEFYPGDSYYVPAHLERAGPFNPAGNNGFNIEHLRNFNNAAPDVAFGFETQPGHGASDARGEYTINRNNIAGVNVDSVGSTTWGGTGVYGAQIGGVWDALLGEGRHFYFFASSDWHNRGIFGPDDRRSTQDFFPGEYQRDYVLVSKNPTGQPLTPKAIVDGLRSGNSFAASGQLIDRLGFIACASTKNSPSKYSAKQTALNAAKADASPALTNCATMGQTLKVAPGQDVLVAVAVRDPSGTNYSPYTFNNPSLAQVGIAQPLNQPVLDHIDVIDGLVTGYKTPGAADYSGTWPDNWVNNPDMSTVPAGAKNTSTAVIKTFNSSNWVADAKDGQFKKMVFKVPAVKASQYLRLRGTNLPPAVPYETDANGNPLPDLYTNAAAINPSVPGGNDGQAKGANLKIPCTVVGTTEFDGCPSHLQTVNGQKYVSYDVAAWSDLWFYSNPIFVQVQ